MNGKPLSKRQKEKIEEAEWRKQKRLEARAWALNDYLEFVEALDDKPFMLASEGHYYKGNQVWITLREIKSDWIFRNVCIDFGKVEASWPQLWEKPEDEHEEKQPDRRALFKANRLEHETVQERTREVWQTAAINALCNTAYPRRARRHLQPPKVEVDWLVKPKEETQYKWKARLKLTWGEGNNRLVFSMDDCMVFDQPIPEDGYKVKMYGAGEDQTFYPGQKFYRVQLPLYEPVVVNPGNGLGAFLIAAHGAVQGYLRKKKRIYSPNTPGEMESRLGASFDRRREKVNEEFAQRIQEMSEKARRVDEQIIHIEQVLKVEGLPEERIDQLTAKKRELWDQYRTIEWQIHEECNRREQWRDGVEHIPRRTLAPSSLGELIKEYVEQKGPEKCGT